jgi:hypothetical protein
LWRGGPAAAPSACPLRKQLTDFDAVFRADARAGQPLALPAPGEVRLRHRVLLAAEIMAAYVPLARLVRSNDVQAMARVARSRDRPASSLPACDARATAIRLGKMVERLLTKLPTDDRCLIRSLVLLRLLGRRGIPARLVIGVRAGGGFGAHAWVEYDGRPILPAAGFDRLLEL